MEAHTHTYTLTQAHTHTHTHTHTYTHTQCKLSWHKQGDFLAVRVDHFPNKSRKVSLTTPPSIIATLHQNDEYDDQEPDGCGHHAH